MLVFALVFVELAFVAGAFLAVAAFLAAGFFAGAFLAAAVFVAVALAGAIVVLALVAAGAFVAGAAAGAAAGVLFGPASFTVPDGPIGDGEVSTCLKIMLHTRGVDDGDFEGAVLHYMVHRLQPCDAL